MNAAARQALRVHLDAATQAPTWEAFHGADGLWVAIAADGPERTTIAVFGPGEPDEADARAYAALMNVVPQLLDALAAAEERVAGLLVDVARGSEQVIAAQDERDRIATAMAVVLAERDDACGRAGVFMHERDSARRKIEAAHTALDDALRGQPQSRTARPELPVRIGHLAHLAHGGQA